MRPASPERPGAGTTLHGAPARYPAGLRELAPGTWAWLTPNGSWGEANCGLVVGDGASAVVDTPWDMRQAAALVAAIAPHTAAAPVRLVVNTHADGDHWWGNAAMPATARVLTSAASLAAMRDEPAPAELARLRAVAAATRRAPGTAGALGRYVSRMLGPFAFEEVRLRPPEEAFAGRRDERVGGRVLRLFEVGPAHTAGDLAAHLPDVGVVFGADVLFFGVTPVMWHGPVERWVAALDALLALDADAYVPGHGPVGGRVEVEALRDYWLWLGATAASHRAAGRSAMHAARLMTRAPDFARFRGWLCPERIVVNIASVYRTLAGKPPIPATPAARARLFAHVAALARELGRHD